MLKSPKNVAVLIYKGVELVDMNGPIDVFLHANQFKKEPYIIYSVSADKDTVHSEGNVVSINPEYTIHDCPEPDIIVIPGRLDDQMNSIPADQPIIDWIKKMGEKKKMIFSVCVGLLSLAETKLLSGKKATTHYLAINTAHEKYKDIHFIKNVRFVEDDNFLTAGGITSGIDAALHLVEKYDGPIVAQQVADLMVYNRAAPLPPYTILPPYYSI